MINDKIEKRLENPIEKPQNNNANNIGTKKYHDNKKQGSRIKDCKTSITVKKLKTANIASSNFNIPKIIHFIWAGGKKHMYPSDIAIVNKWRMANADWTIYIWVDKSSIPFKKIKKFYEENLNDDLIEQGCLIQLMPVVIKDISEIEIPKNYSDCITYEIQRLTPNYGASSDMLRYAILYNYGGAYFDTDVSPQQDYLMYFTIAKNIKDFSNILRELGGTKKGIYLFKDMETTHICALVIHGSFDVTSVEILDLGFDVEIDNHILLLQSGDLKFKPFTNIPLKEAIISRCEKTISTCGNLNYALCSLNTTFLQKDILFVDHLTQEISPKIEELTSFKTDTIGNDTFISSKKNPFFQCLMQNITKEYALGELNIKMVRRAYGARDIKNMTIEITGPAKIRQVLTSDSINESNENLEMNIAQNRVIIKRVRDGKHLDLVSPLSNTTNWLKVQTTVCDFEEAMRRIKKTICFEMENFKIFRLDDHIDDLMESTNKIKEGRGLTSDEAAAEITHIFLGNQNKNLKIVQITGKYCENLIEYIKTNTKIYTIFNLNKSMMEEAFNAGCYISRFSYLKYCLGNNPISFLRNKNVLKKPQREEYCKMIKKGIRFIKDIFNKIEFFDDKKFALSIILSILETYMSFSEHLNFGLEKSYMVDRDEILNFKKIVFSKSEQEKEKCLVC